MVRLYVLCRGTATTAPGHLPGDGHRRGPESVPHHGGWAIGRQPPPLPTSREGTEQGTAVRLSPQEGGASAARRLSSSLPRPIRRFNDSGATFIIRPRSRRSSSTT